MPVLDAPIALTILPLLVELLPLPRLFAIARPTSMEMPKPLHALLAIMVVPFLSNHQQLPLSLLNAHAQSTPTEMVPCAQNALITLRQLVVVLVLLA
jgi:hypothetical protein